MVIDGVLWVFTAAILGVALIVIKATMKEQTNRVANVFGMSLHFTAFFLFSIQIFAFPCFNII